MAEKEQGCRSAEEIVRGLERVCDRRNTLQEIFEDGISREESLADLEKEIIFLKGMEIFGMYVISDNPDSTIWNLMGSARERFRNKNKAEGK